MASSVLRKLDFGIIVLDQKPTYAKDTPLINEEDRRDDKKRALLAKKLPNRNSSSGMSTVLQAFGSRQKTKSDKKNEKLLVHEKAKLEKPKGAERPGSIKHKADKYYFYDKKAPFHFDNARIYVLRMSAMLTRTMFSFDSMSRRSNFLSAMSIVHFINGASRNETFFAVKFAMQRPVQQGNLDSK